MKVKCGFLPEAAPSRSLDVPPILSSTSVESPIIRKGRSDVKKRFTEAQIIGFLREAEAGLPVKELCRRHGFSEASYYLWRSKFGGMNVSDAKRLKELGAENGRLKKLLAESLRGSWGSRRRGPRSGGISFWPRARPA